MSKETVISANIAAEKNINLFSVIKLLVKIGWGFWDQNGNVTYLPLNDDGMFDWQSAFMNEENIYDILRQKEQMNEILGVILYWKKSETGIIFLAEDLENIQFIAEINRREIVSKDMTKETDKNWYLERIIVPLTEMGLNIRNYDFKEY